MQRRVRAQLALAVDDGADRLAVVDDTGTALILNVDVGGSNNADMTTGVISGRSEIFSVSDSAVALVLYQGDVELGRIPLHLHAGTLNTIDGQ